MLLGRRLHKTMLHLIIIANFVLNFVWSIIQSSKSSKFSKLLNTVSFMAISNFNNKLMGGAVHLIRVN